MLLRLHGVPIRPNGQRSRDWPEAEPRNVVGRGLRWPADQRRQHVPQPAPAEARPRQEQLPQGEDLRALSDQQRSSAHGASAAVADCVQPGAVSQLSTATDVDMRDSEVAPDCSTSSDRKPTVDVRSMVAATTALLAEVCPDRSPAELAASAVRYVQLLMESTAGERSVQMAAVGPATLADRDAARFCSGHQRSDQPQQFHIHFGSQVPSFVRV